MKKLLLIAAFAMSTLSGAAKDFTDQLVVTINEEVSTQQTTVTVEELEDNYINFVLSNFVLKNGEDDMNVGNIEINNLYLSEKNGGAYKTFSYKANLQIKPGNKEGVSEEDWIGPLLGNVPLILKGQLTDDKVYVSIDIDMMSTLEQIISVQFGTKIDEPTVSDVFDITGRMTSSMVSSDGAFDLDPVESYVTVMESLSSGDYNFHLNCLSMSMGEESMGLGSIMLPEVELVNRGTYYDFHVSENVLFSDGGEGEWMAAGMTIPVKFDGKLAGTKLYYTLFIDATEQLGGTISYTFGEDFAPANVVGDAKVYEDKIVVTVNEESTDPMDAKVQVEPLSNGGINFVLKNFTMSLEGNDLCVGDIIIEDLPLYESQGYKYFNYTGNLEIKKGDLPGVSEEDWIGPELGIIPLRMRGRLNDNKLYVTIDIDMETLEQVIYVCFGSKIEPETGICSTAVAAPAQSSAIFDLSGRRVENVKRGIFVINGKKVLK